MKDYKICNYTKTHTSQKALESHVRKIKARGGSVRVDGMRIEYRFFSKDKDTTIHATSEVDLIVEAANKGYTKVNVVWKPAYEKKYEHFSKELTDSMKKSKVETLDVLDDSHIILKILKEKMADVISIKYTK